MTMKPAVLVVFLATISAAFAEGPMGGPCATAVSSARIIPDGESGIPLTVEAQVFRPDGKTPAPGVIVYAYQTGADGIYGPRGNRAPRLRGWFKTDSQGRFRIETIRPGSYPGTTIQAHIHFQFWGPGIPEQYGEDLLFDDDPHLQNADRQKSAALGQFANVAKVKDGKATIRFRLKSRGDQFEDNILHGLQACGSGK